MGVVYIHSKVFFNDGIGNGCQECWKCLDCPELGCDSKKWGVEIPMENVLNVKRIREQVELGRNRPGLVALDSPLGTECDPNE